METRNSEAKDVAGIVEASLEPHVVKVSDQGGRSADILVASEKLKVWEVKAFLDKYRERPERKTGLVRLTDLGSFIEFVQRHATTSSVMFADASSSAPSITAVFDYHDIGARKITPTQAGAPAKPGEALVTVFAPPAADDATANWCQFKATYSFPVSDAWTAWTGAFGKKDMGSDTFAEFIEDRFDDLAPPIPRMSLGMEFKESLGLPFAAPEAVLRVSRGLSVRVNSTIGDHRKLQSGETRIDFKSEHTDERGEPLDVPAAFLIHVDLFKGGDAYEVPVRLRYRIAGGKLTWSFVPYRLDRVRDSAIDMALERVAGLTGLPVYRGALA